jgi:hypothetical protein
MAIRENNATLIALLISLMSGLKKNQPNGSFVILGVTYTTAQLLKIFQQILAALQAVPPAKATYTTTVASARTLTKQYRGLVLGLKQLLQIEYAPQPAVLTDYGLTPRKAMGQVSLEVKAAAAEKRLATRAARNTKGPKQKKGITGASAAAASSEATAPAGSTASSAPIGATPPVTPGH